MNSHLHHFIVLLLQQTVKQVSQFMGSGGNGFAFAQTCRHAPIICPQGTLAMMQAANLSATRLGILLLAPERRLPPEMRVPGHKSSHKKKCLQF